jgi:predicted CopG family antitoxin
MSKSIKVSDEVYNMIKDAQGVRETNSDVVEKCLLSVIYMSKAWGLSLKDLTKPIVDRAIDHVQVSAH